MNIRAEFPHRASPEALAIQNKTIYDLKTGIEKKEAVDSIDSFIIEDNKTNEHRCIIAHNANFDMRFLHATWGSFKKQFPADLWLCTKEFTRKFAKKQGIVKPKLSLKASLELTNIEAHDGAHNAVIDSLNTLNLWEKLMDAQIPISSVIKRVPHILI